MADEILHVYGWNSNFLAFCDDATSKIEIKITSFLQLTLNNCFFPLQKSIVTEDDTDALYSTLTWVSLCNLSLNLCLDNLIKFLDSELDFFNNGCKKNST